MIVGQVRLRAAKVKQGKLSATSINKTLTRLAQILEVAVEYGLIELNPAKGKRRRLKAAKPAAVWLDSAEQIAALLDAAGELDRERGKPVYRRALLATFTFAGLRIGELIELRWRDVDLAGGRITVRESKTDAGTRHIDLLPALRDELAAVKAAARGDADDRVFGTQTGGPVTPLVALGVDPGAVMDQIGHEDAGFTLRVYRHGMRRDEDSRAHLAQLVGAERVRKGADARSEGLSPLANPAAAALETAD